MNRFLVCWIATASAFAQQLGLFTNSADVGSPAIKGSAVFADGQYRVTGAGTNIFGKQDQFQFVWREITGNFTVKATLRFLGEGNPHRKAGIMVRQTLDADSAYADVVIHGNGMPALQWRSKPGEDTNVFDLPFDAPGTFNLKLVRTGVRIFLFLGKEGAEPKEIAHTEVTFRGGPVLTGLFVCSHQPTAADTVIFSNVSIDESPATTPPMVGADRDAHGCIGSAGYTYSNLLGKCIRLWESGIRLNSKDGTTSAFLIFKPESTTAVEVFVPGSPTPKILTSSSSRARSWKDADLVLTQSKGVYKLKSVSETVLYSGSTAPRP